MIVFPYGMTTLTMVQIHLGMQQNKKKCLDVPHLALFWMQNDGTDHPKYQEKHFFQQHAILLSECLCEGVSTNNGTPKSSIKKQGFPLFSPSILGVFPPIFGLETIHMKCMTSNFRLWDSCHRLQSACPLLATQEPTDVVTGGGWWCFLSLTPQEAERLAFWSTHKIVYYKVGNCVS